MILVTLTTPVCVLWSLCLIGQGRMEDAEKVLKWLRGPGFDVTPELQALKKAQVSLSNWNVS